MVTYIVFQGGGASLAQVKQLKTPTGPARGANGWLFNAAGPKPHPQIMLTLPLFEHASHEEGWYSYKACTEHPSFHLFLPPSISLHTSDHPASLSHKYSEPLTFRGTDGRFVVPSPCLATLWINLLSAANLNISAFCLLCFAQTWFNNKLSSEGLWAFADRCSASSCFWVPHLRKVEPLRKEQQN